MSFSEKLDKFKAIWSELYKLTDDDYVSFACLTSYHSAKVLSDINRIVTPLKPRSDDELLVFSASKKRELDQSREAEILSILKEAEEEGASLPGLAEKIAQIYENIHIRTYSAEFCRTFAYLELISYLASSGGQPSVRKIDRDFLTELNYSTFQLEKAHLNEIVKFRQKEKLMLDAKTADALRKLITEAW